jgi:hypothetical protein
MEVVEQYGLIMIFVIVMLGSSLIGSYMGGAINAILRVFYAIFGMA